MTFNSVCAIGSTTPGFSLATTSRKFAPRSMSSGPGWSGIQNSSSREGNANPSGITPEMLHAFPSTVRFCPRTRGLPERCSRQNSALRTTLQVFPG